MLYLTDDFSLGMINFELDPGRAPTVQFKALCWSEAMEALDGGFTSAVSSSSTAAVLLSLLGQPVEATSFTPSLGRGDSLIVARLAPQLPEGTEGATLSFIWCTVNYW